MVAKRGIVFRFIHCGIGGAIHNHTDGIVCHESAYGLFIANVQFLYISEKISVLRIFRRQRPHLITKLTVGTGY